MIKKIVSIGVVFTPEEVASEFCNMCSTDQAIFLNEVYRLTEQWERPLCFQLQFITDNPKLTDGARRVMELIGEYARPTTANAVLSGAATKTTPECGASPRPPRTRG